MYTLPALAYDYSALEPHIDAQTMQIHHGKHHQAYIDKLNQAIEGTPLAELSLETLLGRVSEYPAAVRNNAGGHYNHSLFWQLISPKPGKPSDAFKTAVEATWKSWDEFLLALVAAGVGQFGSGWVWLVKNSEGNLMIGSTANQDNPLMDVSPVRGQVLLGIDVWEHAYYLKYQNRRPDYLTAVLNCIDWAVVSQKFENS